MEFLMRFPFESIFEDPFEELFGDPFEDNCSSESPHSINEERDKVTPYSERDLVDSLPPDTDVDEFLMLVQDNEVNGDAVVLNGSHTGNANIIEVVCGDSIVENSYGPLEIEEILKTQPVNDRTVDRHIVSNDSEVKFYSESSRRILSALNFSASAFDGFAPYNRDCIDVSSCGHDMHYECPDRYLPFMGQRYNNKKIFGGVSIVDRDTGWP